VLKAGALDARRGSALKAGPLDARRGDTLRLDPSTRAKDISRRPPELFRCEEHECAAFGGAAHVYDLAAKSWLLPRIVELAEDPAAAATLRALSAKMLAEEPADRPTFEELAAEMRGSLSA